MPWSYRKGCAKLNFLCKLLFFNGMVFVGFARVCVVVLHKCEFLQQ
ncbi:MAG: hypothetical protein ACI8V2_002340 [Candidatus Latescibacterota bacterium]|jgi:hypothetical protein